MSGTKCYRILTGVMVCLMIFTMISLAGAADRKTGLEYEIDIETGTGEKFIRIRRAAAQKELVIPKEIDGLPVREIVKDFIWNSTELQDTLTTLTIEAELTWIPAHSFQYCKKLESVILPDSVETIGAGAFDSCMALTKINFPKNLKAIGERAFGWCRFTEAILPDSVEVIQDTAFCCVPLMTLHLSENLKAIGQMAFEYNHLQYIYIPASVKKVGSKAFGGSNYLVKAIIAGKETTFESDAFEDEDRLGLKFELICAADSKADQIFSFYSNRSHDVEGETEKYVTGIGQTYREGEWRCISLEDGTGMIIDFPKGQTKLDFPATVSGIPITVIGDNGTINSEGFEKVSSVTIPEGVTEIRDKAFYCFRNLSSVKLPETLKRIGNQAFYICKLKNIELPDGLEEIGEEAFSSNKLGQIALPGSLRTVGKGAFRWNQIKTIKLPDQLEEIGPEAFWPFMGKELVIPASVKRIGYSAFGPNGNPRAWTVTFLGSETEIGNNAFGDDANRYYISELTYSIPKVTVKCYPGSTADKYFRFDTIKRYLQWGEDQIITAPAEQVLSASALPADIRYFEVIVPEGVEEIADDTFSSVASLVKIKLPSTLKRIGKNAFKGCPLMEISIPETVESIGDGAFQDCFNLAKVNISPETVLSTLGKEAFRKCSLLKTISLPKSLEEIGEYAFAETGLTAVTVPDSVTAIGAGAFMECPMLTKVGLSAALTEIPDQLCDFCRELKSVNIPAGVKRIGSGAFRRCRLLSKLTFPEGLEEIGDSAFEQFVGGAQMGYEYTNGRETYTRLKKISLPSSLKKLGKAAFLACDALTSVTFAPGCGIEEIKDETFAVCTNLKAITLPDTVLSIGENAFTQCHMLTKADLGKGLISIAGKAFLTDEALASLIVPDTVKTIGAGILDEHGEKLTVTCGEGTEMETYLQENYPEVKIVRPKE